MEITNYTSDGAKVSMEITYGAYNFRRYRKPYAAVYGWTENGKAEPLIWGNVFGNDGGGEIELDAKIGSVVRFGQTDGRNPRKSESHWVIIKEGGPREVTEVEARRHYKRTAAAEEVAS